MLGKLVLIMMLLCVAVSAENVIVGNYDVAFNITEPHVCVVSTYHPIDPSGLIESNIIKPALEIKTFNGSVYILPELSEPIPRENHQEAITIDGCTGLMVFDQLGYVATYEKNCTSMVVI